VKKFIKYLTIIIIIIIIIFLCYYGLSEATSFAGAWKEMLGVVFSEGSFVLENSSLIGALLVGTLILCFIIDPKAAGDGVSEVASAASGFVAAATGGLVTGLISGASKSGLIGWILLGVGTYLVLKFFTRSNSEKLDDQRYKIEKRRLDIEYQNLSKSGDSTSGDNTSNDSKNSDTQITGVVI